MVRIHQCTSCKKQLKRGYKKIGSLKNNESLLKKYIVSDYICIPCIALEIAIAEIELNTTLNVDSVRISELLDEIKNRELINLNNILRNNFNLPRGSSIIQVRRFHYCRCKECAIVDAKLGSIKPHIYQRNIVLDESLLCSQCHEHNQIY